MSENLLQGFTQHTSNLWSDCGSWPFYIPLCTYTFLWAHHGPVAFGLAVWLTFPSDMWAEVRMFQLQAPAVRLASFHTHQHEEDIPQLPSCREQGGAGEGGMLLPPNRIWLSKSSGWNTKMLWRAFHNLMGLEGKKLASICCQGRKRPNNGALSVRTTWVYTLTLAWNRLSFTKTEVQLQIGSFNDCIEGVFPTLILSKSKSMFSLEKENIKSSGCKAIKGIPKSEETSRGRWGDKQTNGFAFDGEWEKEVTAIKAGRRKSDKICESPKGRYELEHQFRITGGPRCKLSCTHLSDLLLRPQSGA